MTLSRQLFEEHIRRSGCRRVATHENAVQYAAGAMLVASFPPHEQLDEAVVLAVCRKLRIPSPLAVRTGRRARRPFR
jgi:hypothetical protein